MKPFVIEIVDWATSRQDLANVREQVFVIEQNVPIELEWDDLDPGCTHVLARADQGDPIGTGRLCAGGHIGRMAVLSEYRGQGVGKAILRKLIASANDQGLERIELNAQTHAVDFYATQGFKTIGDEFMDAGIPHLRMICALQVLHSKT